MTASSSHSRHAVILAAGKGTRMKSDLPKVAMPLAGKPMVEHVLDELLPLHLESLILVVGYRSEVVEEIANSWQSKHTDAPKIQFAIQAEQKGTAHAFLQAEAALEGRSGLVLVTAGDMPLLRTGSIDRLFSEAADTKTGVAGAVLSAHLNRPKGYGRMVRDEADNLLKIVEEKDADDTIKAINEVNTGCYVFQIPEIFNILKKIDSNNNQNEYYLPDAIKIYRDLNRPFRCVLLDDHRESLGANTQEDLLHLEEIYSQMNQP